MSKKRWEEDTLKPTLEKYSERKETLLDERDILNTPEDINDSEIELPGKFFDPLKAICSSKCAKPL